MMLQDYFSPALIARIDPVLLESANDVLNIIAANQSLAPPEISDEAVLGCLLGVLYESRCLEVGMRSHISARHMPAVEDKMERIYQQTSREMPLSVRLCNAGCSDALVAAARWCENRFKAGAPLVHSAGLLHLIQLSESPLLPVDESVSLEFDDAEDAEDAEAPSSRTSASNSEVPDMLEYARAVCDHAGIDPSQFQIQGNKFLESEGALLNSFEAANDEDKQRIAIGLLLLRLGYLLRYGTPLLHSILLVNERTKHDPASVGSIICAISASRVFGGDSLSNALRVASIPENLCSKIAAAEEDGCLDEVVAEMGAFVASQFLSVQEN